MLTPFEIDRLLPSLPRYEVCAGSWCVGLIEQVEPRLGFGDQTPQWSWMLTIFPASMMEPPGIPCGGRTATKDESVAALTTSWRQFVEMCDMASGGLRLVRQHEEPVIPDFPIFQVYAGKFPLGRLGVEQSQKTGVPDNLPKWRWRIGGVLPFSEGAGRSREEAMAQIKKAWRGYYDRSRASD